LEYQGIKIEPNRDLLLSEAGVTRLKESYMREEEISPQERFAFVSKTFATDESHAQRLYDYSSKHWLSYSTPILSYGKSSKGLPISCYLNYINDTAEGLVDTLSETNWLSMLGGGVGIGFGIRSAGDKSTGVLPHLKLYDASSLAYRQGKTRRGSYAAYLDISHPDIIPFLEIRKPTGDQNLRCLNMHHGINITDDFMQIIENCMKDPDYNDTWELKDPHTKKVVDTMSAKELWQRILEMRMQTGEPYLHFIDTSNRHLPDFLKEKGLKINQSNLCSEIILPTNEDRTAVCCLSSLNIEYFDSWSKNPQFIRDVAEMLDNVLQVFINKAPEYVKRAKNSAMRERSIGVGALGFHAYLQSKNVPFEGVMAKNLNTKVFQHIAKRLNAANLELGSERGEAPDAIGTGKRFSHVTAIAPNASSSIIMGNTSPSIEPFRANAYRQDTLSGSHFAKNKYLDRLIKSKCEENSKLNYEDIWSSIISNEGSVQHLSFIDEHEKDVFKTAMEIDQRWVIENASDRQKFIDQAQSVNLFFRPTSNIKYLHAVHFSAWKSGLKTLYYCRSDKVGKADRVSKRIERKIIQELDMTAVAEGDCLACEG
jgi:ribonucleoside-diphosphate reductase alpha chain|tara:strand:+ start:7675 stop:9462 length:1788 start_codon:yes stop_codon:yes gene_type:complete